MTATQGGDGKAVEAAALQDGESTADGLFKRLSDLAWQALPAFGSAAGFVGFVAVIGAAIEWIRFDAAHLPATQAVMVVPKHELVVLGALQLAVFVVGAAIAVLTVYLIDNDGDATVRTVWGLVIVGVIEMLATLIFVDHSSRGTRVLLGLLFIVAGVVTALAAGEAIEHFRSRMRLKRARDEVIDARNKLAAAVDARPWTPMPPPKGPHSTKPPEGRLRERIAKLIAKLAGRPDGSATADARNQPDKIELDYERALHHYLHSIADWAEILLAIVDDAAGKPGPRADAANGPEAARRRRYENDLLPVEGEPPSRFALESRMDKAEGHLETLRQALARPVSGRIDQFSGTLARTRGAIVRLLILIVILGLIVSVLAIAKDDAIRWVAVVLGVVALLTMLNVLVAQATTKFAWYGISVFFSVLLFGAALTLARTRHEPKVQPIALVRKSDDVGICGVYITETSDRVYVGRVRAKGYRPGSIFWVPKSDVELVSVGELEQIEANKHTRETFGKLAAMMLSQLYKDRAEVASTLKNTTTMKVDGTSTSGEQTTTTHEEPAPTVLPKRRPAVKVGETCTAPQTLEIPPRVNP